jgi:hypothetical protein
MMDKEEIEYLIGRLYDVVELLKEPDSVSRHSATAKILSEISALKVFLAIPKEVKSCLICGGSGYFDKPLPDSQVEFGATCECQLGEGNG